MPRILHKAFQLAAQQQPAFDIVAFSAVGCIGVVGDGQREAAVDRPSASISQAHRGHGLLPLAILRFVEDHAPLDGAVGKHKKRAIGINPAGLVHHGHVVDAGRELPVPDPFAGAAFRIRRLEDDLAVVVNHEKGLGRKRQPRIGHGNRDARF